MLNSLAAIHRHAAPRGSRDILEVGGPDAAAAAAQSPSPAVAEAQPEAARSSLRSRSISDQLAPDTLASVVSLQILPPGTADFSHYRALKTSDEAGLTNGAGATLATATVTHVAPEDEPQSVSGLGYFPRIPQSRGEEIGYIRDQISALGDLAAREESLSRAQGVDGKLAFDPASGDYRLLTPGQAGYDKVRSAREVLAGVPSDLRKMNQSRAPFEDLLRQYGLA
ncbi:hypothetical protein [Caulobacter sp.]|uniref:hypothetical protein n=1 Tax=Caulobacter sp. TaxID=78 RepID=UPI003BAE3F2A